MVRYGRLWSLALLVPFVTGCFAEQSFPLRVEHLVRIPSANTGSRKLLSTRDWLRSAHGCLAPLLPGEKKPLLTEDLLQPDGKPVDVLAHFHRRRDQLETLFWNYHGLINTAQMTGSDTSEETAKRVWRDYQEVWIPVAKDISLCGLLGFAQADGRPKDSDCIVLLPGLFGDNAIQRTRDLAAGLRSAGFHVLALELRGHGKTEGRYPKVYYTFGTLEMCDLMAVSEWLQAQPHIRRTGLVGFCWGANEALLAAWYDGRPPRHPSISEKLAPHLRPLTPVRHYEAGVIAFSPVLRFEEIVDAVRVPRTTWKNPVLKVLQTTVRSRMEQKRFASPSGSLRALIDEEYGHSELNYPRSVEDALHVLRFLPYKGLPDDEKLMDTRVPTLIVQGANDPLACAQDVADLIAKIPNPNVGAVVLAGGGHVGMAAYATRYYFSLIVNFFDSATGPRPLDWKPKTITEPVAGS